MSNAINFYVSFLLLQPMEFNSIRSRESILISKEIVFEKKSGKQTFKNSHLPLKTTWEHVLVVKQTIKHYTWPNLTYPNQDILVVMFGLYIIFDITYDLKVHLFNQT